MHPLAGFDLALELSTEAILALLRSQATMFSLSPPTEQSVDIPASAGGGRFHLVFLDVELLVRAGPVLTLRLSFRHASLIGNTQLRPDATRLSGHLDLDLPLSVDALPHDAAARVLAVHLERANATARLTAPAGDTRSYTLLEQAVGSAARALVRGDDEHGTPTAAPLSIPLPIRVDPAAPPSLAPLVCRELQLLAIVPASADERAALVLVANLLQTGAGDPSQLARSHLPAGRHAMFSLSPQVFHALVFTPAVQQALAVTSPALLPPTVGQSQGVPYPSLPSWTVTRVADSLQPGLVRVELQARTHNDNDSSVWANLVGNITLPVAGGAIRPSWTTASSGAGEDFGAGFWLGAVLLPALLATMGLADAAYMIIGASLGQAIAPGFGSLAVGLPVPGLTLVDTDVDTDHVSLLAVVERPAEVFDFTQLRLSQTSGVDQATLVESGTYASHGCPEGNFGYTRTRQQQRVTFTVSPEYASFPIQYRWSVAGFNAPVALDGTSGTVAISAECVSGAPPTTRATRTDVAVAWELSEDGATLTLRNRPEDGDYAVNVTCTSVDAEGRTARAFGSAPIAGDALELHDGFDQQLDACARSWRDRFRTAGLLQRRRVVPGGPGDDFQPSVLEAVLAASREARGAGFLRNLSMRLGGRLATELRLAPEHAIAAALAPSRLPAIPPPATTPTTPAVAVAAAAGTVSTAAAPAAETPAHAVLPLAHVHLPGGH
ncbi:MAG TPA: hypothetical protein VHE35_07055 [Kofleriaceae bacterium]|nr:hypothetical protein [Kofleriaceae bacterium]